ncbi:MAG TPA: hypothetical protein VHD33_05510 [Legionellaceae bacterium]|nr:hypothetical protein [Legionellaceae bacterium]
MAPFWRWIPRYPLFFYRVYYTNEFLADVYLMGLVRFDAVCHRQGLAVPADRRRLPERRL